MAKNSIRDFDATSGNNTDIQSVDISEGCAASGINNALRELMTDLKNVSTGAVNLETPAADRLDVDNIRIDGNTISSTDTNGDITLDPNGTGKVAVPAAIEATTSTHANASVFKSTGNTQLFLQDTDASANDQFWGFQVSGGDFNVLTCNDDRASGFVTPLTIAQAGDATFSQSVIVTGTANRGLKITSAQNGSGQNDADAVYDAQDTEGGGTGSHIFKVGGSEKVRIDSSGNLLLGTATNLDTASRLNVKYSYTNSGAAWESNNTATHNAIVFKNPNGLVGTIQTSGSSTAYNTSSDHRLKENVADMTGAITRVKALAPKRFNFIADADRTVDGFLAHEAQAVVPEAVTGTKDEVDDDGNAVMQGIDQSKLVPLLTGALQEAIAKIETLEIEMTALKARVTALEA